MHDDLVQGQLAKAFFLRFHTVYLHQSPDSVSTVHAPKASSLQLLRLLQTGTLPEL